MAITFDGPTKRINLTLGTISLSVRELWSAWVDWIAASDNSKYLPAFESLGGNDIDPVAGTKIPVYAFLVNGWRIKPQESSHTLAVADGIVLVDGGGDPFVNTTGAFVVRVNYQQPVQAISFSSDGGGGATPEQIAAAVLDAIIEGGLSLKDVQRLLLAVAAGRTSIVAGGNSTATVSFRDQANSKARITASMTGSERTSLVLDPTE